MSAIAREIANVHYQRATRSGGAYPPKAALNALDFLPLTLRHDVVKEIVSNRTFRDIPNVYIRNYKEYISYYVPEEVHDEPAKHETKKKRSSSSKSKKSSSSSSASSSSKRHRARDKVEESEEEGSESNDDDDNEDSHGAADEEEFDIDAILQKVGARR